MPPRNNRNARNSRKPDIYQEQPIPSPSQLPTPLPEEDRSSPELKPEPGGPLTALEGLIDFDAPLSAVSEREDAVEDILSDHFIPPSSPSPLVLSPPSSLSSHKVELPPFNQLRLTPSSEGSDAQSDSLRFALATGQPLVDTAITTTSPDEMHLTATSPTRLRVQVNSESHGRQKRIQHPEQKGHVRSPVLAPREPTMLETFSRTVRNYVPSSIPIPSAAPSPPLVSRPVSFGSFMIGGAHQESSPRHTASRRSHDNAGSPTQHARQTATMHQQDQYSFDAQGDSETWSGITRAMSRVDNTRSYPRASNLVGGDPVVWARWESALSRRLLFLAYPAGLQIWDCTSLDSVSEVFNVNFDKQEWGDGHVIHAAILASTSGGGDEPLLGILSRVQAVNSPDPDITSFSVYSLHRQHTIKRVTILGRPSSFISNEHVIVLSTSKPLALHVLSRTSFETTYNISASSLSPFAHKLSGSSVSTSNVTGTTGNNNNSTKINNYYNNQHSVLLQQQHHQHHHQASEPAGFGPDVTTPPIPSPVFALSHRLLAYACPPPEHDGSSSQPVTHPSFSSRRASSSAASSASGGSSLPSPFNRAIGMSNAELGSAALRVGGSVLSGMKAIGGLAYSAAKSKALGTGTGNGTGAARGEVGMGSPAMGPNRFFSRSAPSAGVYGTGEGEEGEEEREGRGFDTNEMRGRRYSNISVSPWDRHDGRGGRVEATSVGRDFVSSEGAEQDEHASRATSQSDSGYYVKVVDLKSLWQQDPGGEVKKPRTVVCFLASRSQPISGIHFSPDGNSIVVATKDGQVLPVFGLRPHPQLGSRELGGVQAGQGGTGTVSTASLDETREAPWHVYNLKRGRTSAVIEQIDWAGDGRWIAIGTRKRTVHVFAVNPYGGKADHRSHMEGRVRNVDELPPLSTEISPLVRFRAGQNQTKDQTKPSIAFKFLDVSEAPLPTSLLPAPMAPSQPASYDPSLSPPLSPHSRPANYQDVLFFDPVEGVLSLRRVTVELHSHDQGLSAVAASVSALGTTSISLPGMGGAGRLSGSPAGSSGLSRPGNTSNRTSGTTPPPEVVMDMTAKDSIVATWRLQRGRDWAEVRKPWDPPFESENSTLSKRTKAQNEWLSEAELSTFSGSPNILPRSIYLSHQFSFHSLGEDYHALIRRHRLGIVGYKINVRKTIEVSAYSAGTGESFVEGLSAPRNIRQPSSSFDEPLASALSGGMGYSPPTTILPMLPNGASGSRPKSFRNSAPIRTMVGLGDGVTEGLGRLRKEVIHKVRSPQLKPKMDGGLVSDLVTLEFDEEDEDFQSRSPDEAELLQAENSHSWLSSSRGDIATVAMPRTAKILPQAVPISPRGHGRGEDDAWLEGDKEDEQAIEEAEGFDAISFGVVDEEHSPL